MSGVRRRLLGDRDRLGWLTLPLFLVVGLTGAVLAGALSAVYFGQQVDALEDETRDARQRAAEAAAEVEQAREDALAEIEEQVAGVREALTRDFPFDDVFASGVVVIRAYEGAPPPEALGPTGDIRTAEASPILAIAQDGAESPSETATDSQTPPPAEPPSPAPQRPIVERAGTGFAISVADGVTFFATTYAVVADAGAPGGVVQRVEVITPAGTFPGVVHSWDEGRDLAVVRAEVGEVAVPLWRSSQTPVALGERVVVAGTTPTLNGVQIAGSVGFVDVAVLVTDLPPLTFLAGAPIVDASGQVVGIYSLAYAPFGAQAGERQSSIPIRLLCERMLQNCDALEAPPADS